MIRGAIHQERAEAASVERSAAAVARWLEWRASIGQKEITSDDVAHSALLRRLMAGRDPLPERPPLSFGQPWYALFDEDHVEWPSAIDSPSRDQADPDRITIHGDRWRVVSKLDDGWIVAYDTMPAWRWMLRHRQVVVDGPDGPSSGSGWRLEKA